MGAAGDIILELRERNISLTNPLAKEIAEDYQRIEQAQENYQSYTGYTPVPRRSTRSSNKYSSTNQSPQGAVRIPPVPDSSPSVSYMNKLGQPRAAPVPTAWETIRGKYNDGNWFTKAYDKLDYGLFGWLPMGIPRDIVKAADQETKAKRRETTAQSAGMLSAANELQEKAEVELDFSKKSWYEDLFGSGFMFPQAERDYQSNQSVIRENTIIREQIAGSGLPPTIFPPSDSGSQSFFEGFKENVGAIAGLGIGAIILIMAMKK